MKKAEAQSLEKQAIKDGWESGGLECLGRGNWVIILIHPKDGMPVRVEALEFYREIMSTNLYPF